MSLLPDSEQIRVEVVGPAYSNEIVEVTGELFDTDWLGAAEPPIAGPCRIRYSLTEQDREPLDEAGTFLLVQSPAGDKIRILTPAASTGRRITTVEDRLVDADAFARLRGAPPGGELPLLQANVRLREVHYQLGGMGAGYALALGGRLTVPLGEGDDQEIRTLLDRSDISYTPVNVPGSRTDTNTVILSTAGDKLPIGRRSASAQMPPDDLLGWLAPTDILVITSLPGRVAAEVAGRTAGWTIIAPSLRNVRENGFEQVARKADALSMNDVEWASLTDQEAVRLACPLVVVTRGADGAVVSHRRPDGSPGWTEAPGALVKEQIADPNHVGEAFTAGFLGALVDLIGMEGLRRGRYEQEAVREAALQGSLAACLEMDIRELGFPSRGEILALREHV